MRTIAPTIGMGVLMLAGCAVDGGGDGGATVRDSAGVDIVENAVSPTRPAGVDDR